MSAKFGHLAPVTCRCRSPALLSSAQLGGVAAPPARLLQFRFRSIHPVASLASSSASPNLPIPLPIRRSACRRRRDSGRTRVFREGKRRLLRGKGGVFFADSGSRGALEAPGTALRRGAVVLG
ncbi:hypothetical protein GUJ93_ZPchr0007g3623 [Zizania palustris]|uniref:Uncharacterized protein n=1 Tax=Zizania palustris TaxID=103762 RepID=A0A8J5SLJ2_ZIZPA|nr:hypothetical protein GUJ93_ZPchr0007g3623 [Zizania palustris]